MRKLNVPRTYTHDVAFEHKCHPLGQLDDAMRWPKTAPFAHIMPWSSRTTRGEIWHCWHREFSWRDSSRLCIEPGPDLKARILGIKIQGLLATVSRRGQYRVVRLLGGFARFNLRA